jgi:hypothetical protein
MMRRLAYALPATLSLALIGCGGGPDINQVKADFDNPSGSVQSKDGMIAASGSLDASGSAVSVAGGGVPGNSLTAYTRGFDQINMRRTWEWRARGLRDYLNGKVTKHQALRQAQFGGDGCTNSAEAQGAFEEASQDFVADGINPFGNSKIEGSATYSQDFSACSGGELSGSAKVHIEILLESNGDNSGRLAITVQYDLNNVCELNTAEKACLDGTMIMEAEAIGQNDFGSLTFTAAWDFAATWTDAGGARSASAKGGLKSSFEGDGTSGSAKIEVLSYVNSPEGEWSYVWSLDASYTGGEGSATIGCRGSDGSVMCTIDDNGGMCTSSDGSSVTWTTEESGTLDASWYE